MKAKNEFMVKPYSKTELSELYGVSVKTLTTWMKPFMGKIGAKSGRFYTVKQIETLFENIGVPHLVQVRVLKQLNVKSKKQSGHEKR